VSIQYLHQEEESGWKTRFSWTTRRQFMTTGAAPDRVGQIRWFTTVGVQYRCRLAVAIIRGSSGRYIVIAGCAVPLHDEATPTGRDSAAN